MPTIPITDKLGVTINATLAPASTFLKYAKELPSLLLSGADLSHLGGLTLSDPLVNSLAPGLTFQQPVSLGTNTNAPELTIGAGAAVSFEVISGGGALFLPDQYGDNIAIPAAGCYVSIGFQANLTGGVQSYTGTLTFGMDATAGVSVSLYQPFSKPDMATTLAEALRECVGNFVMPASPEDLAALPAGTIVTMNGHGTLQFSGTANLLAMANPLATLALPSPVPTLSVQQGAAVTIGASWEISTDYQVRVQKVDTRRVRLGWYRKHESEISVTASADVGISAGTATTDLFPRLIAAISSNAQGDLDELQKAGLSEDQAGSIAQAVKAAVDRNLQVGLAAELSSLGSDEAAFLYEVDLSGLSGDGVNAVRAALRGNLSGVADATRLPAGITAIRSILTTANTSRFSLKVNLLGIFNYASVSRLTLSGKVTYTPSTGDLVIADTATASLIQSTTINFGADEDKLLKVMSDSFLITAAYRGSRAVISPPQLASSHLFFKSQDRTNRKDLRRFTAIAPALRLAAAQLPTESDDFGRTSVFAEARYDDALARALFLQADGTPHLLGEYETAGRRAITCLVLPDGDDAFRLKPATDDALWKKMKTLGQFNFHQLFPPEEVGGVSTDYVAIRWWADSMFGTAGILAQMDRFFSGGSPSPDNPEFQNLRQQLASHMRDVAAKAEPLFGQPWGLVAMFLVGQRSETAVKITGPRFVYAASRALGAAV
jgi:hypothetical protein